VTRKHHLGVQADSLGPPVGLVPCEEVPADGDSGDHQQAREDRGVVRHVGRREADNAVDRDPGGGVDCGQPSREGDREAEDRCEVEDEHG